eukprot:CAMPEP_0170557642 /NCGR_PEP_ID=MMETSP0211-20121228/28771_1 /TAXON_ID=311385 /ORGANISM="Pseudokeronopsis sp., Strain OXSARD2" /LENGTH=107 /DNA_ID=CAMNT_0010868847 /DNA_START=26 /DNA_END=349 /DNA_ORIENTATION=-
METENKTLVPETAKKGVEGLLAHPKYGKYFVAVHQELQKPIGCLYIHLEVSPALGGIVYWINSVFTDAEFRKIGVFKALYNLVLEKAKSDPMVVAVRLYVEVENEGA